MKKTLVSILPLLSLITGSYCSAADTTHELTLNLAAGAFQFAGSEDLRDGLSYDLRLGYDIYGRQSADSIGIEAGVSYIDSKSSADGTPAKAYLARLDATYPLVSPRSRTVPFLAVGAGALLVDRSTSSSSSPVFAYGAGLKHFLTETIALRLDWRHNLVYEDVGTTNNFQYLAGVSWVLHSDKPFQRIPAPPKPKAKKSTPAPAQEKNVPPVEQEKKGPEKTPAPEPVGPEVMQPASQLLAAAAAPVAKLASLVPAATEPAAKEPAAKAPPQASAKKAPQAPKEEERPAKGSAAAPEPPREKAAVEPLERKAATPPPSAEPRAPESLLVARVQRPAPGPAPAPAPAEGPAQIKNPASGGCPVAPPPGSVPRELSQPAAVVLFDTGSAQVKPRYLKELRKIAAYLKKHPDYRVRIEGHTDRTGKVQRNEELSLNRAKSIEKALAGMLERERVKVEIEAFGCRIPVETNRSPLGREHNRRGTVELEKP